MQLNIKSIGPRTYEAGPTIQLKPIEELKRAVLCCLLWENNFYESGEDIVKRISDLVIKCSPFEVMQLAIKAKISYKLRHIPLLLATLLMSRGDNRLNNMIFRIITRVDDMMELVALYWRNGKKPLPAQLKKALAACFNKFDEYQFAKYNRDKVVKLRDIMFLVHPKPKDEMQAVLFKKIADQTLAIPDTWEVALSSGADKKETFIRLITEGKLGYLALLRNLRNMEEAKVDKSLIKRVLIQAKNNKILPYQFISAARAAPWAEDILDSQMQKCMQEMPKLTGKTILLVDVSGSMMDKLSTKSILTRMDAASSIAVLLRGICEDITIISFSDQGIIIPPRHGIALIDAIINSQPHNRTYLGATIATINSRETYDRIVVLTDEQSYDAVLSPKGLGYMINVGVYKNAVGFGPWVRINGFSEAVVNFIIEYENNQPERRKDVI